MLKHTLVAGIMSLGFIIATPAMAQGNYDSQRIYPTNHHNHQPVRHCVPGKQINRMQRNQRNRIEAGVQNGSLVRSERAQLNQQQANIAAQERQMRGDGCLTTREFDKLISTLKWTSGQIHALTTNHLRRGQGNRHGGRDRNRNNRH